VPWKSFTPRGENRFSMCCLISVDEAKRLETFGDWLVFHGYIRSNSTYSVTKYGLKALLEMADRIRDKEGAE